MARKAVYYRIGETARILGVSQSSLRNWEQLGLFTPVRSQGQYRLYSRKALNRLKRIKYLRRVEGVNPAGIAAMLRAQGTDDQPVPERKSKKKQESIGRRLARLRHQVSMTLTEVGRKTGLSVSFLSSLERGHANASIATLQKLAHLYNTNVLSFFGEDDNARRLVRPRDRRILKPNSGVQMELLAFGNTMMEPHLFRIAPGATSGGCYHHEGEEFIYVLHGTLEIWLDQVERYVLKAGDSFYFESNQTHSWRSLSDEETVLLWINTPATF